MASVLAHSFLDQHLFPSKMLYSGLKIRSQLKQFDYQKNISALVGSYSRRVFRLIKFVLKKDFSSANQQLCELDSLINTIEGVFCQLTKENPGDIFEFVYEKPIVESLTLHGRDTSRLLFSDTTTLFTFQRKLAEIDSTITYWKVRTEFKFFLAKLETRMCSTL
jgi:hypothetical protein